MVSFVYLWYVEWKHGVVFNGEKDIALLIAGLETILYAVVFLLWLLGSK